MTKASMDLLFTIFIILILTIIAGSLFFVIRWLLRKSNGAKCIERMPDEKEIDSFFIKLSDIDRTHLQIDPEFVISDKPVIQRPLTKEEFESLKEVHYHDKEGWQLSRYAYMLENKCPYCGNNLYLVYQSSPSWTWKKLCGRAGFLVFCPTCRKELLFCLTSMN